MRPRGHRTRSVKLGLPALAMITAFFVLAGVGTALADNVVNNIDTTVDSAPETRTITAGDPGTTVGFWIEAANAPTGDASGCNATGANPVTVSLNVPAGVTASATSVQVVGCSSANVGNVTFTSNTPNVTGYTIGVSSVTGGKAGSLWNLAPATFRLVVNPSDTTAPVISYVLDPAAPDGNNGWYRSDVALTWTVTDPESSFSTTGCANQSITSNQGATTYSCSAVSAGGSSGPVDVTIKRDAAAPSVSASPDRAADSNGWYRDPVTIEFSASDLGPSGGVSCDAPSTYSGPEGTSLSVIGHCWDAAGNEGTASFGPFNYDGNAPAVVATPDRPTDHNGWYNAPFSVTWSSIGADLSDNVTCSGATNYDGADTGSGSVQGTCTDAAGNVGTGTFNFKYDATAPTDVGGAPNRAPDHGSWYTSDVDVVFNGSDATSGIAGCDTIGYGGPDGAGVTSMGSCTDEAGNTSTPVASSAFDFDVTAPSIQAAMTPANPDATGWYNIATGSPTVSFTCSDATSGLAVPCPADFTFGEGSDQSYERTISDNAGHSATGGVSGVSVDVTAPTIIDLGPTAPADGSNDWYVTPVTNQFHADGEPSGLDGCDPDFSRSSGSIQGPAVAVNSGPCSDRAGNTSAGTESAPFKIDLTAPTIHHTTLPAIADGSNGWYVSSPTITFGCSDAQSDIDSCLADGQLTNQQTLGESAAAQNVGGTAINGAGLVEADVAGPYQVDLSDPSVSLLGGPAQNATYVFGSVPPPPTCTASDPISGLAAPCSVSGYSTAVGPHTVTAHVTDNAGRTGVAARSYIVLSWTLKGFYAPVDMNGTFNTVKGGSTVPLKFEVFAGASELTDTSVVTSLKYSSISCNATAPVDDIETTATGGTTLRYDTMAGQFIYNWQTPRVPGACLSLVVRMQDGGSIVAFFKVK